MLVGRNTGEEAAVDHGPASRRDGLRARDDTPRCPRERWVCGLAEGGGCRCEDESGRVYGADMLLEESLPGSGLDAIHGVVVGGPAVGGVIRLGFLMSGDTSLWSSCFLGSLDESRKCSWVRIESRCLAL